MPIAAGALGGPGLPGKVRIGEAQLTSRAIMETDNTHRFISDIQRSGERLMEKLSEDMAKKARRYAPRRSGRLKRSIKAVLLSNGREARVFSDVPYAGVMESGSKPHLIHGVRANFDWKGGRFVWNDQRYGPIDGPVDPGNTAGGRESARRSHHRRGKSAYQNWSYAHGATVRHPGTKPHYFMHRAFHETWPTARAVMVEAYHR